MKSNEMSLRQKIGQLIVTGFQTETMSEEFIELVKEYKVANTILFSYNTQSAEKIKALCSSVQKLVKEETGEYAFISIDQEGGVVTRLPKGGNNIPGAMALAQTRDPQKAYEAAFLTAQELKELGVNFNLAPVLDINSNPSNPVIGVRSFGGDAKTVTDFGCAMVKGYLDAGMMCSIKHFPGHGDTAVDSHLSLPCVAKTYDELKKMELIPFEKAIACGATAVTLAHILFPKIEEESIPATMSSKIINNILKEDLGFTGLVISDCLEMNAITNYFGTAIGAKRALKAGVDLLFISHSVEKAKEAIEAIEKAVENGEIPITRIDEAVDKVLGFKALFAGPVKQECSLKEVVRRKTVIKKLFKESIYFCNREKDYLFPLGKWPLFLSCDEYRANRASNNVQGNLHFATYMQEKLGGKAIRFSPNPEDKEREEIISEVQKGNVTSLVIGTYNGHLNKGQVLLAKELEKMKIPMMMVALRNPYDLEEVTDFVAKIAAYEYTEQSFLRLKELMTILE